MAGAAIRNQRMHGWDPLYLLCEAPRAMVILEGIEAVLTLLGAAIGLWLGGLTGAAIGSTLVALGIAVADFLYLRARFGLTAPIGAYLRIAMAGGVMVLALRGLPWLDLAPKPEWVSVLGSIAFGAAVYAAALALLFPRLSRELWAKARQSRRGDKSAG